MQTLLALLGCTCSNNDAGAAGLFEECCMQGLLDFPWLTMYSTTAKPGRSATAAAANLRLINREQNVGIHGPVVYLGVFLGGV